MRGSLVVLALAITPFVAKVSRAQDTVSTSSSSTRTQCEKDPGNPSPSGDENRTKKCPPPPTNGRVTITGTLFFDLDPLGAYNPPDEVGIAGWNVVLTGPTGTVTFMTDATGFFSFSGLPTGATYTLCVVPSPGWTQTLPTGGTAPCTNSFGYTIDVPALAGDAVVSDKNFGFFSS